MSVVNLRIPRVSTDITYEQILGMRVKTYNEMYGTLGGYDCRICRNKGDIAKIKNGQEVHSECGCMKIRETLRLIKDSGLEKLMNRCTFDSYICEYQWQKSLKDAAVRFAEKSEGSLFMGGQTGCGKTHLCTAAAGAMISRGKAVRYFVWREDSTALKALANTPEYGEKISVFKTADVLYIDDLFKQNAVNDADLKLAFELIDYRLRNEMTTMISSEKTI